MLIKLECPICKDLLPHNLTNEGNTLPPNTYLTECYGCGRDGLKLISKQVIDQGLNNL